MPPVTSELKDNTYATCEIKTDAVLVTIFDLLYQAFLSALAHLHARLSFVVSPATGLNVVREVTGVWALTLTFQGGRSWAETLTRQPDDRVAESFVVAGDWYPEDLQPMRDLREVLRQILLVWNPVSIEVKWR